MNLKKIAIEQENIKANEILCDSKYYIDFCGEMLCELINGGLDKDTEKQYRKDVKRIDELLDLLDKYILVRK